METRQLATIELKISNYYRFIHSVFIKSTDNATKMRTQFDTFCEKYSITQKDKIYSLLESIKNDKKAYKNFEVFHPEIIGYSLLFIIYYLKNNSDIFYYLNMMLLLMKATSNARFTVRGANLPDDNACDSFIEKTIDEQERINTLIKLTRDVEQLTQQINDVILYKFETKINDKGYLQFTILFDNV